LTDRPRASWSAASFADVLDLPGVRADKPSPHAGYDVADRVFGKRGLGESDDSPDRFQGEIVLPGVGGHPAVKEGHGLGRAQETVVSQVLDRPSPIVCFKAEVESAVSCDDLHGGRERTQAGDSVASYFV